MVGVYRSCNYSMLMYNLSSELNMKKALYACCIVEGVAYDALSHQWRAKLQ